MNKKPKSPERTAESLIDRDLQDITSIIDSLSETQTKDVQTILIGVHRRAFQRGRNSVRDILIDSIDKLKE